MAHVLESDTTQRVSNLEEHVSSVDKSVSSMDPKNPAWNVSARCMSLVSSMEDNASIVDEALSYKFGYQRENIGTTTQGCIDEVYKKTTRRKKSKKKKKNLSL